MKKTGSTIIYILFVILLLGGAIAGLLYLTNGGTTAPRLFDVKHNDTNIDGQIVTLSNFNEPVEFVITSKIGDKLPSNIQVRVLPNENAKKVMFAINGDTYNLVTCKDLTALFSIEINENNITVSSDWNMKKFLADYFAVTVDEVEILEYEQGVFSFVDLHFIVDKTTVKCGLFEFVRVDNIELDNENIIVGD